jgi:hypothetical protein
MGALGEGAALLAQDVDRLVDRGIGHFGGELFDLGGGQIADLDFGIDLEHGVERSWPSARLPFR